jgi:hypothetical protein
MGHASISTTAEFYSTVTEDHAAIARSIVDAIAGEPMDRTDAKLTLAPDIATDRRAG